MHKDILQLQAYKILQTIACTIRTCAQFVHVHNTLNPLNAQGGRFVHVVNRCFAARVECEGSVSPAESS